MRDLEKSQMISKFKNLANRSPFAFAVLGPLKEEARFHRRVVRRGDDLVIEGYPRSANTYVTEAFRQSFPGFKIGNHFHSPMQIALAARYGVPTLVVVRTPIDAARSFYVYHQGRVSAGAALKRYIFFHETAARYLGSFAILDFTEAIQDVGIGIDRLNARFGLSLQRISTHETFVAHVKKVIEEARLSRVKSRADSDASRARQTTPSDYKIELSAAAAEQFEAPHLRGMIERANALYQDFLAAR